MASVFPKPQHVQKSAPGLGHPQHRIGDTVDMIKPTPATVPVPTPAKTGMDAALDTLLTAPPTPASQQAPAPQPVAPVAPPIPRAFPDAELVMRLLDVPALLESAQARLDAATRNYESKVTLLSIEALSVPLFPGKKEEDPKRPASNDTERDLAIQHALATNAALIELAQTREIALRQVTRLRNELEAAKILAAFLTATAKNN